MSRTIKKVIFFFNYLSFTSTGYKWLYRIPNNKGYISVMGQNARKYVLRWILSEEMYKNMPGRNAKGILLVINISKLDENSYHNRGKIKQD